jgi:beta-phosphoglucomutase
MLKAVILDFDGVIADTEALHLEAFNEVLSQYNIEISDEDYYEKYLGYSDVDFFNALNDDYKLEWDDSEIDDFVERKGDVFQEYIERGGSVIKGVPEFIAMLRKHNIPLAICSGATMRDIEGTLSGTNLLSNFQAVVSADDVLSGKPDPQGYMMARKKLVEITGQPISGEECIAVEDSEWGLEAARAASMHTLGVTNSYAVPALGLADKVVDSLGTVTIEMLREICK